VGQQALRPPRPPRPAPTLDPNGPYQRDLTSPTPPAHQTLHALHHNGRDPRDSTGAADADAPSVAKSQAASSTTIHARTQQVKRAAALSANGGALGGGAVGLTVSSGGQGGGAPGGGPPGGGSSRAGSRLGASSRASAHDARARAARLLALMVRLAPWLLVALVGVTLLFIAAPGAEGGDAARPTPYDVLLQLGPYFFNPSIVKHRGVYLSTARTAHMKRIDKTNWWFNDAYICMSTDADFSSVSCRKFDPWQG
jgi:hypothetical protein